MSAGRDIVETEHGRVGQLRLPFGVVDGVVDQPQVTHSVEASTQFVERDPVLGDAEFLPVEIEAERKLRQQVRSDPDMRTIAYAQALQEAMREEMERDLYGPDFLLARPLLQAIQQENHPRAVNIATEEGVSLAVAVVITVTDDDPVWIGQDADTRACVDRGAIHQVRPVGA